MLLRRGENGRAYRHAFRLTSTISHSGPSRLLPLLLVGLATGTILMRVVSWAVSRAIGQRSDWPFLRTGRHPTAPPSAMTSSNGKTAVTASGHLARNVAIMVSVMPEAGLSAPASVMKSKAVE